MAQKVEIILEDDLDGGIADETVRFGLDGKNYEIDLSKSNSSKLRDALEPFVTSARTNSTGGSRRRRGTGSGQGTNSDTKQIREWAKANGYPVADRGRIHEEIREAYYAVQKAGATPQ